MGASVAEAEDSAQRAMEDVLHRWNEISSPAAYAHKAANNYFIKDRSRSRHGLRRIVALGPPAESDDSAERALTRWEDREWVEDILSSLPPAQREVVALVTDGWGLQEITERLGKTPETVRQNLHNARQRLKEFVGPAARTPAACRRAAGPGARRPAQERWPCASLRCAALVSAMRRSPPH